MWACTGQGDNQTALDPDQAAMHRAATTAMAAGSGQRAAGSGQRDIILPTAPEFRIHSILQALGVRRPPRRLNRVCSTDE